MTYVLKPSEQDKSSSLYEDISFVPASLFPPLSSFLQPGFAVIIELDNHNLILAVRVDETCLQTPLDKDIKNLSTLEYETIPTRFMFFDLFVQERSGSKGQTLFALVLKREIFSGRYKSYFTFKELLEEGVYPMVVSSLLGSTPAEVSSMLSLKYLPMESFDLHRRFFLDQESKKSSATTSVSDEWNKHIKGKRSKGLLSGKKFHRYVLSSSNPLLLSLWTHMYDKATDIRNKELPASNKNMVCNGGKGFNDVANDQEDITKFVPLSASSEKLNQQDTFLLAIHERTVGDVLHCIRYYRDVTLAQKADNSPSPSPSLTPRERSPSPSSTPRERSQSPSSIQRERSPSTETTATGPSSGWITKMKHEHVVDGTSSNETSQTSGKTNDVQNWDVAPNVSRIHISEGENGDSSLHTTKTTKKYTKKHTTGGPDKGHALIVVFKDKDAQMALPFECYTMLIAWWSNEPSSTLMYEVFRIVNLLVYPVFYKESFPVVRDLDEFDIEADLSLLGLSLYKNERPSQLEIPPPEYNPVDYMPDPASNSLFLMSSSLDPATWSQKKAKVSIVSHGWVIQNEKQLRRQLQTHHQSQFSLFYSCTQVDTLLRLIVQQKAIVSVLPQSNRYMISYVGPNVSGNVHVQLPDDVIDNDTIDFRRTYQAKRLSAKSVVYSRIFDVVNDPSHPSRPMHVVFYTSKLFNRKYKVKPFKSATSEDQGVEQSFRMYAFLLNQLFRPSMSSSSFLFQPHLVRTYFTNVFLMANKSDTPDFIESSGITFEGEERNWHVEPEMEHVVKSLYGSVENVWSCQRLDTCLKRVGVSLLSSDTLFSSH